MGDEATESVQVDFTLTVGDGRVDISTMVPLRQMNLTELLPVLHSIEKAIIDDSVEQIEAAGMKISCKAGCGACCRQLVPLSIFEAEALSDWIRTLPVERQQELEQRFHRVLLELRDAGMLERIVAREWLTDEVTRDLMGAEYFRLGLACPFLENESCSIHPIRPLSCREYLVTSPAELCVEPLRNKVTGVMLPVKLSRALFRMGRESEADLVGLIPLVFLMAWMKGGVRPGAAYTGLGPEVLYEVVKRLETTTVSGPPAG
jgi:Fe-S-cluster containining protein